MLPELGEKIGSLKNQVASLRQKLDIDQSQSKIGKLEARSSQPDFWQDREQAQQTLRELAELKEETQSVLDLEKKVAELAELAAIAEKPAEITEVEKEIKLIMPELFKLQQLAYFSGAYDKGDAILSLHAGQGGTEACDWAEMLSRMYQRYAERKGWKTEIVDEHPGEEAGIKSMTMIVHGRNAYGHLKHERGTHRLVRLSPFNADNLRQTSFALAQVLPVLPDQSAVTIKPEEVEISFSRSAGHGGQNVNKVSTAVRLKHLPTGMIVECQTERFQEQNRKIALSILASRLWAIEEEKRQSTLKNLRGGKTMASWGTQIRSYVLHPYKLVKDLRTEYEEHDPVKILDGEIDNFILASLKSDQSGI